MKGTMGRSGITGSVKRNLRGLAVLFGRFLDNGGIHMAASISYNALMSLFPLIIIMINLFGYFLGHSPNLHAVVLNYIKTLYPMAGPTLTREISRVVEQGRMNWIGLAVFLWLGSLVFSSVEFSINTIFKADKRRKFIVSTAISFGMVMLAGVFLVVSFWAAWLPQFILRHQDLIPMSGAVRLLTKNLLINSMSVLLTFVSFTLIYKLLPHRKVTLRHAAWGGLVAAFLWETAKYTFAWYIGNVADIGGIYGSLSAIIVFLLWIYYSAVILLLVAEMVFLLGEHRNGLN